jgi:hypothetical protein
VALGSSQFSGYAGRNALLNQATNSLREALAIGACLILALLTDVRGKWLTTAGLLMDLLGLALLDISGVFGRMFAEVERMFAEVERLDAEGDHRMSRYVREIIDNPDEPEWEGNLRRRVFHAPQTGVQLIAAGCTVQLVGSGFDGTSDKQGPSALA